MNGDDCPIERRFHLPSGKIRLRAVSVYFPKRKSFAPNNLIFDVRLQFKCATVIGHDYHVTSLQASI